MIINYCSGGLGNRLIPLVSCMMFASAKQDELSIVWPQTPRCMAKFESLFENNIKQTSFLELEFLDLNDTVIYANYFDIVNDAQINNIQTFLKIADFIGCLPINQLNLNEQKRNIIIYHNTFLPLYENINSLLKELKIKDSIIHYVNEFISSNAIDTNVYGIHARSTDFVGSSLDIYKNKIEEILNADNNSKIYFCSDNPEWEEIVKKLYQNNIIIRTKEDNVHKINKNYSWINNAFTSELAVVEGLKDILILSKTNITFYNPNSTFALLAKRLQ
jgi:hypothetical protein